MIFFSHLLATSALCETLKYNFSRLQNAKVRILFEGLGWFRYTSIQFNLQCNSIQFNLQCNSIQSNSIQFNSIWNTQRQSRSPWELWLAEFSAPSDISFLAWTFLKGFLPFPIPRNSLPRAIFPSSRGRFLRDSYLFLFRGILCPERDFPPRVDVS